MPVKRRIRATGGAALISAALVAAIAPPARAHPEATPAGVSRYITVAAVGGEIEISDAWLVGAVPAVAERRRLDTDGDGLISEAERARGEVAEATSAPVLSVAIDGVERAEASMVAIDLGKDARVGDGALVIERRRRVVPAGGPGAPHQVRLTILREPPKLIETEVAMELEPGLELTGKVDRVRWAGSRASALEERSVTFAFAPPGVAAPAWQKTLAAVAAVVGVAALAARARARARRAAARGRST